MNIVVGVPAFKADGILIPGVIAPAGQLDAVLAFHVRLASFSKIEFQKQLLKEYWVVIECLLALGLDPKLLYKPEYTPHTVVASLVEYGYSFMSPEFTAPSMLQFPRDAWTRLSHDLVLLNPESGWVLTEDLEHKNHAIYSHFGEGGRVHAFGDVIIAPEWFVFPRAENSEKHILRRAKQYERPLLDMGFRVVYLPNPIFERIGDGGIWVEPDDHLDRVSGFLLDHKGNGHLVVSPTLRVGLQEGYGKVLRSVEQSISSWKRLLDPLEIEVHVPERCGVPLSCGFYQTPTGEVMVTSGDEALVEVLASIVGRANLYCLNPAIELYSSLLGAGIHCLINEAPDWLLQPYAVH